MKRYTITEGAKTTAGGVVLLASSRGTINGARIALENDPIFCKECGEAGRIVCVGPRLAEVWNEIPVALDNDLCICGCTPYPRLITKQTMRYQTINSTTAEQDGGDSATTAFAQSAVAWTISP